MEQDLKGVASSISGLEEIEYQKGHDELFTLSRSWNVTWRQDNHKARLCESVDET